MRVLYLRVFCLHLQPVCRTCNSKPMLTTTKSQRELLSHFYVLFYFSHDVKLIIYAPFMLFMLLFWCIFVLHLVHVFPLSSSLFSSFSHECVCIKLCKQALNMLYMLHLIWAKISQREVVTQQGFFSSSCMLMILRRAYEKINKHKAL